MKPVALFGTVVSLILGLSQSVASQTVTVRSGEHQTFSRLTISLPSGMVWSAEGTNSGYRLRLDGEIDGFDLSQVFERIPRDRITDVVLSDQSGGLEIVIGCDCHMTGVLYRPDLLVLDVVDGPAPAFLLGAALIPRSGGVTPALPDTPPVTLAELSPGPILPLFVDPPAPTTLLPGDGFATAPARSDALVATERAILESFARAASQGVFDFPAITVPSAAGANAPAPPLASGLSPVTDPMDGMPIPQDPDAANRPGLILRTGIARGEDEVMSPEEIAASCAPVGRLDTAAWVDERGFHDQIGAGRLALTTETGQVVSEAVLDQARRYVAFGFGVEASEVLTLLSTDESPEMSNEIRTLLVLARIVDGSAAPASSIARAIGCGPDAAIWATLARDTLGGTDDAERDAALVGFRNMPASLRGHLGLRLATLFSDAGEALVADQIMAAARGQVTGGGLDADLTQAAIDGAARGPEAEIAQLDAIAERNPRLEPETLVRLMDLTTEAGRATDPAVLDLAEALRFEVRGTEQEGILAAAEARALIAAGDIRGALSLIDATADILGEGHFDALFVAAYASLTDSADDETFLDLALKTPPSALPALLQNDIAARLLALGFPDLARSFVARPAAQEAMRERRYLRAAAAAALGDVSGTELALEGMTDPRAQELRAVARDAIGDFTGAYEARDRIPDAADRLAGAEGPPIEAGSPTGGSTDDTQAWRAGDWAHLEASEDSLLSSASRAILSAPVLPGEATPLADRQDLIGQAEETRALTEALLERFAIDPLEGG